ncbi:MAG: GTPase Era [Pseudomonadales bacterium]
MATNNPSKRCGYVAIVGRPNVGKSTLLNRLIGQKISITSRKPQTTRHAILGIKTTATEQVVYVDTPGLQQEARKAMNRYMNRAANSVLRDVDCIVFVLDRLQWQEQDRWIVKTLAPLKAPILLAINKVDQLADKKQLLPFIDSVREYIDVADIVPLAALSGANVNRLEHAIKRQLPESDFFFPPDQLTDRSERFLAGEIIREKLVRQLGHEIPYEVAVEVEEFSRSDKLLTIAAVVFVERSGQKAIVIGHGGQRLRQIGSDARADMEKLFEQKIMLRLWVKVKQGWSDDERALQSLGMNDLF